MQWHRDCCYDFFLVNMVDLFRQMLFSAETIKVSQARISVDLLTLQSSNVTALTFAALFLFLRGILNGSSGSCILENNQISVCSK